MTKRERERRWRKLRISAQWKSPHEKLTKVKRQNVSDAYTHGWQGAAKDTQKEAGQKFAESLLS